MRLPFNYNVKGLSQRIRQYTNIIILIHQLYIRKRSGKLSTNKKASKNGHLFVIIQNLCIFRILSYIITQFLIVQPKRQCEYLFDRLRSIHPEEVLQTYHR